MKKTVWAYTGLFIVAIIWGLAFAVVKSSLDYMPPVYLLAFRFSMAALVMSLVCFKKIAKITPREVKHGIIIGIFLFIAYFTQTIGCKYTTAGKNAFLTALYIIVVPFLHWIIDKKRPHFKLFIAAVIGIIGIGFISLNGDKGVNIGDVLTMICGIVYACQIVCIDRYAENDDTVILAMLQMIVCAVLGIICAPIIDGGFPYAAMRSDVWIGLLYLGLFSTLLGFLLQTVCQKYTKPENASLIMSTEAVWGVVGSVIFLGEVISARMLIGCVLMMMAIVLAQVRSA